MANGWIWARSVGRSTCRSDQCQRQIWWAEMVETGKRMCFDDEPVSLKTETRDGQQAYMVDLSANHWATCPGAKEFKRR